MGKVMEKVAPSPGAEGASRMCPSISSTSCRVINKPYPPDSFVVTFFLKIDN